MASKEKIIAAIYEAIDEVNLQLSAEEKIVKSTSTILFDTDTGGTLTSLVLINLIVEVESRIEQAFHTTINLMDESEMAKAVDPFKTIDSLTEYIDYLLENHD